MSDPTVAFARRFEVFRNGIAGMAASHSVQWSSYFSDYVIDDDGIVSFFPKSMDSQREGLDELIAYCEFLLGQGFYVEVGACLNDEGVFFHVVSWEGDDEPEWPTSMKFDAVLRS